MSVKLEWVPSIEASDRRKAGWVEVLLYGGAFVAPGCFLMASLIEEEGAMSKAPGSGESDRARGLYNKFSVMRSDGSSAFGKKHHGCEYFVLDLTHDKFAWPALHAYAGACADEFPALSGDLSKMCVQHEPAAPVLFVCPNCNKQTNVASEHEAEDSCIVSGLKWTCEPAQPEPTTADRIAADLAAGTFRGVRPEPAAPKGMAGVCFSIEGERWHEPGTCPHCTAPAAPVGNEDCVRAKSEGPWLNEVLKPAVRSQAAEARAVELPKVREALVYLRRNVVTGYGAALAEAAIAELDTNGVA